MAAKKRNFFEGDRLNVRRLRHDLAETVSIMQNMMHLLQIDPARHEEYEGILNDSIHRVLEISESLGSRLSRNNLVEVNDV